MQLIPCAINRGVVKSIPNGLHRLLISIGSRLRALRHVGKFIAAVCLTRHKPNIKQTSEIGTGVGRGKLSRIVPFITIELQSALCCQEFYLCLFVRIGIHLSRPTMGLFARQESPTSSTKLHSLPPKNLPRVLQNDYKSQNSFATCIRQPTIVRM